MKLHQLILLLLLSVCGARADAVGYGGRHEAKATDGKYTAHHVHDWGSAARTLSFDFAHHDRFYTRENKFSSVELRDASGKLILRSPCPAFDYLWISPDAEFLVGLSSIKLHNPHQLVVWKRDGTLLHCEHISSQVAKLTEEQRAEFAKRFPKAETLLAPRYFTHAGATYLDFAMLGMPNEIGDQAWAYLSRQMVRHPYSDDFSESVTNSVEWYDKELPDPEIHRDGDKVYLSLRSRLGKKFRVLIKK